MTALPDSILTLMLTPAAALPDESTARIPNGARNTTACWSPLN